MRPKWFPDWSERIAIIVASGPSASTVDLTQARDRASFIAVNNSWRLAPWSDVLFAADYVWWQLNNGCPEFAGIKVTIDRRASENRDWGIKRVLGNRADTRMEFDDLGHINGRNSGMNAINLAIQFGAKKIMLAGFDMCVDHGLHWDGAHPEGLKNPTPDMVSSWRRILDGAAESISRRGIRIINCSPISALKRYPKMHFAEALEAMCRAPAC